MATTISGDASSAFWDQVFNTPAPEPAKQTPPPTPPNPDQFYTNEQILDTIATPVADTPADLPAGPDQPVDEPTTPAVVASQAPITEAVATTPAPTDDDDPEAVAQYTAQVFKKTAQNLINKGVWKEVDKLDEIQFDEDTFTELSELQFADVIEERWNRIKQSSDVVYGIVSLIEEGGNPEKLIDHFKTVQEVNQLDTSSEEGKLQLIEQFYKDVVGLSPANLTAKMKRLETAGSDDIEAEFTAANEKFSTHFAEKQKEIEAEERQRLADEKARKEATIRQTYQVLKDQKVHTNTAKKLISDIYQPKWQLSPDSEPISELDYQLLQWQTDPQKQLELARFILDKDNYLKSHAQQAVNAVVDDTYGKLKFIPKKAQASSATTPTRSGSAPDVTKTLQDFYKQ